MMHAITYQNERYQLITAENRFGSEADRINILSALGIFICIDGSLFIRHANRNKKKAIFHNSQSIEKAIIAQSKILNYYPEDSSTASEMATLVNLEDNLDSFMTSFNSWYNLTEIEKEKHDAVLQNILRGLGNYRLKLKEEIAKQLQKLSSPKDSLNRINPGAKGAIASSLKTKAEKRLGQMNKTRIIAEKRRWALLVESQYMRKNLKTAIIQFGTLNYQIKDDVPIDRKKRIGQILHLLQSVWINPYTDEANALRNLISKL